LPRAQALATSMVAIGSRSGVRTEAVITDMNAPLGRAVGNAMEIVECLETLKGRGPADLVDLATRLAVRMIRLAGLERDEADAARRVDGALSSGRGLETFLKMVEHHGGDPRIGHDYSLLQVASECVHVCALRAGYVSALRAEAVGRACHALGAGRSRVGQCVDHGVGILARAKPGDAVAAGDVVLELLHRGGHGLETAQAFCRDAIVVSDEPPPASSLILGTVD
jgi:thymidine phosphorylase